MKKPSLIKIKEDNMQILLNSYETEQNIEQKQQILLAILDLCYGGVHSVPNIIISDLKKELDIVFSGFTSDLIRPPSGLSGRRKSHPDISRHIDHAVCYINLCKTGIFSRKNYIKFITDCYQIDRTTVYSWLNDDRYNFNNKFSRLVLFADHTETGDDKKNAEWFLRTISGNLYQNHQTSHSNKAHIIRSKR